MKQRDLTAVVSFLLATSLTACGGGGGSSLPTSVNALGSSLTPATNSAVSASLGATATATTATATYTAIDAGGAASGNWIADTDYNGGLVYTSTAAVATSRVTNPPPQSIYQTQRYAPRLTYTIPNLSPNAAYTVRLHFAETFFTAAGKRVFSATINGTPALTNYDIFAAAGGRNIAIAPSFSTTASATGSIVVAFTSSVNNASLAGIEVTKVNAVAASPTPTATAVSSAAPTVGATPTASKPVLLVHAGGGAVGAWSADADFNGGWIGSITAPVSTAGVAYAAPQAVYQTARYSAGFPLTYVLPKLTPSAAYTLRLHFVEPFFTSAGQRTFNVAVNGTTVLSKFDIFKAAGAQDVADVQSFPVNADANGNITVTLTAVQNYAIISGLEVDSGAGAVASPTPDPVATPTPTPTVAPTTAPTAAPVAGGSIFSDLYRGNTPFHHKVATLMQYGATVESSTIAANFYAEGFLYNRAYDQIPMYSGGTQAYGISCPAYGTCNAAGKTIYLPSGWEPQCGMGGGCHYDYHLVSEDPTHNGGSIDMWGDEANAGGGINGCFAGGGNLDCAWGVFYSYSGSGLSTDNANPYSKANAAGYAYGLFQITAQDLINANGASLDHALGLATSCEGGSQADVYPSNAAFGTDVACKGGTGYGGGAQRSPNTSYGNLIHLVNFTMPANASPECKTILNTLMTYGAYTTDNNGGYGIALLWNSPFAESASLWNKVETDMNSHGEGSGNVGSLSWGTNMCLNYITSASQLQVITVNQGGTAALPPAATI